MHEKIKWELGSFPEEKEKRLWILGARVKNTAEKKHGNSQKAQTSMNSIALLWWKEFRYIRTHVKSCLLNISGKAPRSCCWRLTTDHAQVKLEFYEDKIDLHWLIVTQQHMTTISPWLSVGHGTPSTFNNIVEHLLYTVPLMCLVGRCGKEDRALWRNLVLTRSHFLYSSPLVLFTSSLRGILDSLRPKKGHT